MGFGIAVAVFACLPATLHTKKCIDAPLSTTNDISAVRDTTGADWNAFEVKP